MPTTFDEKWKPLFEKFDVNGDGKISMEAFQVILYKYGLKESIDPHKLSVLESTIEENIGGYIGYHEFLNIMNEKRSLSFSLAVRTRLNDCVSGHLYQFTTESHMTRWQYCLKLIGNEFLTNDNDRANFTSNFRWCLPPVLIICMCLIEIGFYVYSCVLVKQDFNLMVGPVPKESILIFNPSKKIQLWRFFTYFVFHAGLEHLIFSLVFQLLIGLPLELVHGTRRIATILFFGILAGSMGSSVLDPMSYACGVSAGVYALMAGHLANRLTHYSRIREGAIKLGIIIIFASADFGVAVWRRFSNDALPISFVPHLMGVVMGLTFGLLILRNYDQKLHERFTMWIAMMLWCLSMLFVVLWNVFFKLKSNDDANATEEPGG
ncbi:rhomboid-related protein 3-like [Anneissia japonica]|uniref:rhomboid-related protein 3-like n=1 Tax=Anneissia japonica TaxID=1529436 RepID=UPI0014254C7F|nr:rhomboid-related protein 3-like [Anneissia japonica]